MDEIAKDDMEFDLLQDRKRELAQEVREGEMDEWIKDHIEDLRLDFCNDNDEFRDYCKEQFYIWEKD